MFVGCRVGWAPCLWGAGQGGRLVPYPLGPGQGGLSANGVQGRVGTWSRAHRVQGRVGTLSHILWGGWSTHVPQNPPHTHSTGGRTLAGSRQGWPTAAHTLPDSPLPTGGPSPVPMHPKRSPTSTGDAELKEERMPTRKASCSVVGSGRGMPPSSPMVSSANNPNKSEIPDRHKDGAINTVGIGLGA